MRALHPACDVRPSGMPDGTDGQTVVVDQRREFILELDPAWFPPAVPPAEAPNCSVLAFFPPGNNILCIAAVGTANVDFRTATNANGPVLGDNEVFVFIYTYEETVVDAFMPTNLCCFGNQDPPAYAPPPVATLLGQPLGQPPCCGKPDTPVSPFTDRPIRGHRVLPTVKAFSTRGASGASRPAPPPPTPQGQEGAALPTDVPPPYRVFGSSVNSSQFEGFRILASSCTAYFNAPQLETQGFCHVYNGATEGLKTHPTELFTTLGIVSNATQPISQPNPIIPFVGIGPIGQDAAVHEAVIPNVMRLPFDEGEMTRMRANPYVAKPMDGFYSIHRPNGLEGKWVERDCKYSLVQVLAANPIGFANYEPRECRYLTTAAQNNESFGLQMLPLASVPWNITRVPYVTQVPWTGAVDLPSTNASLIVPWLQNFFFSSSVFQPVDSFYQGETDLGYDEWTSTVAIWRGISSRAAINFKRNLVLEGRLYPLSPLASQLRRPPIEDFRALEALRILGRAAPSIYPAKANALGDILKWVEKITGWIGMGATALTPLVPELLPVAMVAEGVSAIAGYAGSRAKSKAKQQRAPAAAQVVVVKKKATTAKKKGKSSARIVRTATQSGVVLPRTRR